MTTQARSKARTNLDHVDASTDEDGKEIAHDRALVFLLTGIGYALLDVADAIRHLAKDRTP